MYRNQERKGCIRMKVLVTGVTGQLGYDCVRELEKRGIEVRGVSSRDFSLTDPVGFLIDYFYSNIFVAHYRLFCCGTNMGHIWNRNR